MLTNGRNDVRLALELLATADAIKTVRAQVRLLVDREDPAVEGFNDPWPVLIYGDDVAEGLVAIAARLGARGGMPSVPKLER